MAMTPEEKRIAKNEASKRWYAKHKAAIAKTAASDKDNEEPATDAGGSTASAENDNNADDAPENVIEQTDTPSDDDAGFEEDYDEETTETDEDDLDEDEDELDEWAAGREDMFREFGAQGYMEED